jgi:hypothetical protein
LSILFFPSLILNWIIFNYMDELGYLFTDPCKGIWLLPDFRIMTKSVINIYVQLLNSNSKWLCHFASPSAMDESSLLHIFPSTGVSSVLDFGHSNKLWMIDLHCNLHFLHDVWCGASFHMHNCHLHYFCGEMFVKDLDLCFNKLLHFLIID